jgi:hypothetical protein
MDWQAGALPYKTRSLLSSQLQQFGSDASMSLFPFAPFTAVTTAKHGPGFSIANDLRR